MYTLEKSTRNVHKRYDLPRQYSKTDKDMIFHAQVKGQIKYTQEVSFNLKNSPQIESWYSSTTFLRTLH